MPTTPPRAPKLPAVDPGDLDGVSPLIAFGTACGGGLLAAAFASAPAAERVTSAFDGGAGAWAALVATELPAMWIAIYVLRRAREGLRAFGGPGAKERALAATIAAALLFAFLALLGAVLRATTHHHALAGATFAATALASAAVLVPVAARAASIARGWIERRARLRLALAAAVAGIAAAAGTWRVARALLALSPETSAVVVDLVAFAVAALLASRPEVSSRRVLAWFGPPASAVVFAFGVESLTRSPALESAIIEHAAVFEPAVRVFVH